MPHAHDSKKDGIAATLSECALCVSLNTTQLLAVASISRIMEFGRDETITRAGECSQGVYIVQSGLVCLFTSGKTERQRLCHTIGAGRCFSTTTLIPGENAIFGSRVQSKTAKLIFIPQQPLLKLYKTIPQMSVNVSAVLCDYIRLMITHAQRAMGRSIETRLAGWLLAQPCAPVARENGGGGGGDGGGGADGACAQPSVVTMQIKKTALSCDLNVTCQSLSRAFQHFREQGLIATKGKRIFILNRPGIEKWAAGLHRVRHANKCAIAVVQKGCGANNRRRVISGARTRDAHAPEQRIPPDRLTPE